MTKSNRYGHTYDFSKSYRYDKNGDLNTEEDMRKTSLKDIPHTLNLFLVKDDIF